MEMKTRDYVIVANGNFLVREIILEATKDKIIVALDGAAGKLNRLGIKPHVILGDFDSLTEADKNYFGISKQADKPYHGNHNITVVPAKDQKYTDFVKAIRYCDEVGAKSINVICAAGGLLDHYEGALRALRTEYNKSRPMLFHTAQQTIQFAKNETVTIPGEIGEGCGVLAFPEGSITSTGLEYEMEAFPLKFGYSESTRNSLQTSPAKIIVQGEALVVMPPQLSSQRNFIQKSNVERLELLLRDARCIARLLM